MTVDVFWQRIEGAIRCDNLSMCPVKEYAKETNTVRMCEKICDCADGLKMLHKKLQEEERLDCIELLEFLEELKKLRDVVQNDD